MGDGSVESNDVAISATDGSSVAFGEGSDARLGDVNVDGNTGTVQVAGDDSTQAAATDNSISDSGNTTVDYSDNSVDNSVDYSDNSVDNSVDTTVDYSDNSTTSYTDQSDDDGIDIDASVELVEPAEPAEVPLEAL